MKKPKKMASSGTSMDIEPQALSDEEARAVFDEEVRRRLNMSTEEFLEAWDAGRFTDPEDRDVLEVSMLIPWVR